MFNNFDELYKEDYQLEVHEDGTLYLHNNNKYVHIKLNNKSMQAVLLNFLIKNKCDYNDSIINELLEYLKIKSHEDVLKEINKFGIFYE